MPRRSNPKKYESQEYWNQLLAEYGLSVDAGRHPKIIYVGDSTVVTRIHDSQVVDTGRVSPKPNID